MQDTHTFFHWFYFFGVHLGGGIEQIETELFHFETYGTCVLGRGGAYCCSSFSVVRYPAGFSKNVGDRKKIQSFLFVDLNIFV